MKPAIPAAILQSHTAILGKTGSGKTSTSKLLIEQVVESGARVCVLDTVKSDWWGLTSSASGKSAGLPFTILGGPRGHLPLHSNAGKAIGQLVGTGKLPLSIVDMADFEAGGIQRFFADFAQSLMRNMRGVVYLVIEEAHEVAPKERAGFGAENLSIHWAKKLATAGRSKGIRLIVATQRVQALHNAILGSCETVIAHRLTTPADQKPILDWLKANASGGVIEMVSGQLSSLKTGAAWVCSGEARIFERIEFPKFKTYDNTATPTGDGGDHDVKTAAVNEDELRAIIGDAVKDAEANDPKALKAEIARLKSDMQKQSVAKTSNNQPDQALIDEAHLRGYSIGHHEAAHAANQAVALFQQAWDDIAAKVPRVTQAYAALIDKSEKLLGSGSPPPTQALAGKAVPAPSAQPRSAAVRKPSPVASGDGTLTGPQRELLKALAWWKAMGHDEPSRAQVASIAGWRVTSGHLKNVAGSLKTAGLIEYPREGRLRMTPAGEAAAPEPDTGRTLADGIRSVLNGPQLQVFNFLFEGRRQEPRELIASALGWEPTSGHLKNIVGSMRTLEIVDYPVSGVVALQDWVR